MTKEKHGKKSFFYFSLLCSIIHYARKNNKSDKNCLVCCNTRGILIFKNPDWPRSAHPSINLRTSCRIFPRSIAGRPGNAFIHTGWISGIAYFCFRRGAGLYYFTDIRIHPGFYSLLPGHRISRSFQFQRLNSESLFHHAWGVDILIHPRFSMALSVSSQCHGYP